MKKRSSVEGLVVLIGMFSFTIFVGAILLSSSVNADNTSVVDEINVTVPIACTIARSNGTGTYTDDIANGVYGEITGSTFTIYCNDNNGYAVYAIGYSGDSYTDSTHTTMIGASASIGNIATGLASSGNTSNWNMWLTNESSATYTTAIVDGTNGNENFTTNHVIPSTFTKVAYRIAGTDNGASAVGSKIATHYGVYISDIQPAGTYTGKVKYILVHPNTMVVGTYNISYDANGGSGTMATETSLPNYLEHTLATSTLTPPTGEVLKGWCTTNTSRSECTDGTFYEPGHTILPSTVTNNTTLILYAIWGLPTMQQFAANQLFTTCSDMSAGDTITLIDSRDGTSYKVGKLVDGKCWMLDNLALDLNDTNVLNNLSSTNTDIDENSETAILTSLRNGNRSASDQYATAGLAAWSYDDSFSVPMADLASKDVVPSNAPTNGHGNNRIGGYYNYCAASAGSYCYGDDADPGIPSGNATSSICPKGWRLPTGNTSGEFSALANAIYGSTGYIYDATASTNYRNALSLPFSGLFTDGQAIMQGHGGFWWSSTRNTNHDFIMYPLYIEGTTGVSPADTYYSHRSYGNSIRCIMES